MSTLLEREITGKMLVLAQLINPEVTEDGLLTFIKNPDDSQPEEPPQWIPTGKAMSILGCSKTTIYNCCKAGTLTHKYLGGGVTSSKGKLRILLSDCYKAEPFKRQKRVV